MAKKSDNILKIGLIIIVLVVAGLITGLTLGWFGSVSNSTNSSDIIASQSSSTLSDYSVSTNNIEELEIVYADILRAYAKGISAKFEKYTTEDSPNIICDQFWDFDIESMRAEYAFHDVDMDGTKELLVGIHTLSDETDRIWDIWSVIDSHLIRFPDADRKIDATNGYPLSGSLTWIRFSWKNYGFLGVVSAGEVIKAEETDWEEVYADVLQAYTYGVATDFEGYEYDAYNPNSPQNIIDPKFSDYIPEMHEKVLYAFYDIDGNGVKELLFGADDSFIGRICLIWTVTDGQLKEFNVESTPYKGMALLSDGRIAQILAFDGMGTIVYKIAEDGFNLEKEVLYSFHPGNGYYYQDFSDPTMSEPQNISEEEYERVKSEYTQLNPDTVAEWFSIP